MAHISRRIASFFVVLAVLSPARAHAQEGPPSVLTLSGDLGMGNLGSAALSVLNAGMDIREGQLALGILGRVRFVLADTEETTGVVRARDWDEVSDFVHLLNYFQYRHQLGSVGLELQAGELLGYTLGHGTIVRGYSNVADPDHLHAGATLQLTQRFFDVAAMIDNLVAPHVIASRVGVRPLGSIDRFAIGVSAAFDPEAPIAIREDLAGVRVVDDAWNLQADTETLGIAGVDVEYRIGNKEQGRVTPYADLNTSFHGAGFHTGADGEIPLGQSGFRVEGRVEYHLSSGGYIPAEMQTFYDLERFQAGLSFSDPNRASGYDRATLLSNMKNGVYDGHGFLTQAGLAYRKFLSAKLGYSQRPGPDGRMFWARLTTQPISLLDLGALFIARGLGEDNGTGGFGAIAEARFRLTPNLYALGQYSRLWYLPGDDVRFYAPFQAFNIGLGGMWNG